MKVIEVSIGKDLALYLNNQRIATLDGCACSNETADLFVEVRENLELFTNTTVERLDLNFIPKYNPDWTWDILTSHVERHLMGDSWMTKDSQFWNSPSFNKYGFALYECVYHRVFKSESGKEIIDRYPITVIVDSGEEEEAINIAEGRLQREVILSDKETVEFSHILIIDDHGKTELD